MGWSSDSRCAAAGTEPPGPLCKGGKGRAGLSLELGASSGSLAGGALHLVARRLQRGGGSLVQYSLGDISAPYSASWHRSLEIAIFFAEVVHYWTTGFTSVPMPSIVMRTMSPAARREVVGRDDAGSGQEKDSGREDVVAAEPFDQLLERRAILAMLVSPRKTTAAPRSISIRMPIDSRAGIAEASVIAGPRAQQAS